MAAKTKGRAEIEKKAQALKHLDVVYVPVDSIKPNPWNPNRQSPADFALLLSSMREDGFTQGIVVVKLSQESLDDMIKLHPDKGQNYKAGDTVIVDGEHRWRAAAQLDYKEIPVTYVPMELVQAQIATLRHNRARGSEDMEIATEMLRDLETLGETEWAKDSLGLDDTEWNRLIDDVSAPEALAGEEFGQGWEPERQGEDADIQLSDRRSSSTPAAVQAQRDAEAAMKEARSEEERAAVRRDFAVYRTALTFADEEAKIVKAVIGKAPAQTVLALCKSELDKLGVTPDEALAEAEQAEEDEADIKAGA